MKEIKNNLFQKFVGEFARVESRTEPGFVKSARGEAFGIFNQVGFPSKKLESWKKTDLKSVLEIDFEIKHENEIEKNGIKSIFKCDINNFGTELYTEVNGFTIDENEIETLPCGAIVGSLKEAWNIYPEIFERHFNKIAMNDKNGFIALNTAFFNDGYFVYVPDNVEVERTVQLVNIIKSEEKLFVNSRNLVVLGKNSSLKLVLCDDSISEELSFVNSNTEIFLDESSKLDLYKLQNKDSHSTVLTNTFVHQEKDSNLCSNTITLNGGIIRNDTSTKLAGRGANADIIGLYLVDRKQFIDNHVKVDHAVEDCTSNQLFKGIIDDEAQAVFNGHILVRKDAQRTAAFQSNKNIQLTDSAKVNTHPFLEIYADDVKCSHGATVGQLDDDALFYMMQRGICERNAKMLLMYSFTLDVIGKIKLPVLKDRIEDLVQRRLKGELSACEQCSIQCTDPNKVITFDIDYSKI